MKVAIVHDWLVVNGGAEKVVEAILSKFKTADIFTLVDYLPKNDRDWLNGHKIKTSFIQNLPFAKSKYRNYFPLFPIAIEQFDLSNYDLIISSNSSVAKGVITNSSQIHICYCHSPARYAWDMQHQYLRDSGIEKGFKSIVARYFLHKFRIWDSRTANGVDQFIANSKFIQKRIFKVYRRNSIVVYPPVNLKRFEFSSKKDNSYMTASRLVPYKRIDLIVEAFTKMPDKYLNVIGTGPELDKILKISKGFDNIKILGYQPNDILDKYMMISKAFIFAAEEDFGIVPLEAQACGTPVIAFGKGGALETVIENKTGILFYEQTSDAIIDAVNKFESLPVKFSSINIRNNVSRFSEETFINAIDKVLEDLRGDC